jgi:short-subunit dehydrogenase
MQLQGKLVLITGASRGIGEALAHRFAGAGAKVALVARTQDALRSLAAELGGTAHPADLSDPTEVATLIQRVEEEAGPIDVLVNNAGIDAVGGLCEAPPDELRRVTEVNYLAPAELCRQVIPRMLERGGGHIVNVSSGADCMVIHGLVTYSASKAALSHFTAGLRADFRGLPIGTTLVEIGPTLTDMLTHTEDYEPTARSFERTYRLRLAIRVPPTRLPRRSSRRCRRADGTYGSPSAWPHSQRWPKCLGERRRSC